MLWWLAKAERKTWQFNEILAAILCVSLHLPEFFKAGDFFLYILVWSVNCAIKINKKLLEFKWSVNYKIGRLFITADTLCYKVVIFFNEVKTKILRGKGSS